MRGMDGERARLVDALFREAARSVDERRGFYQRAERLRPLPAWLRYPLGIPVLVAALRPALRSSQRFRATREAVLEAVGGDEEHPVLAGDRSRYLAVIGQVEPLLEGYPDPLSPPLFDAARARAAVEVLLAVQLDGASPADARLTGVLAAWEALDTFRRQKAATALASAGRPSRAFMQEGDARRQELKNAYRETWIGWQPR